MCPFIDLVRRDAPLSLFTNLQEQFDAAFAAAWNDAQRYERPERANMLGQARHARCEAAARTSAALAGLSATALHTTPPGGRFSVIQAGSLLLLRCAPAKDVRPPRPAKFRREFAALNAWLDEQQLDLLDGCPPPPSGYVCGLLIVTANRGIGGDASIPDFMGLGFPNADLSGWLRPVIGFDRLIAAYHDAEAATHRPQPETPTIKDEAKPQLRRQSRGETE